MTTTLRRARPSSPTEIADSKRRSTVIEPFEEFTLREDVISPIDTLFAYCEGEEETYCDKDRSLIYRLFNEHSIRFLEAEILKKKSDFLDTAKVLMKDFLKLVVDKQPISGEEAENLLRGVTGAWLNPCFGQSLVATVAEEYPSLMGCILYHTNQDSVADRTAHMMEDPYFKISMLGSKKPTSTSTFLRLFVSILIGYWCEEGLLRELDKGMEKNVFGREFDMMARAEAKELAGIKDVCEDFSFDIEDASDAKDLEPLRQLLVSRYGEREDRNIEAILEETKRNLSHLLDICQNHLGYDGKKTNIELMLCNGRYCLLEMGPYKKVR